MKVNSVSKTYTQYHELKSSSLTLYPLKTEDIPEGFTKTTFSINEIKYDAYEKGNTTITYAMNIETGEKGFYRYEKTNNVFMKYDKDTSDDLNEQLKEYKLYIYALCGVSTLLIIISFAIGRKNSRMKKLLEKFNKKEENK